MSIWSNLLGMLLKGRIQYASLKMRYMVLSKAHEPGLISSSYRHWRRFSEVLL